MTKDNRFEEAYNDAVEGSLRNMCEVLDRVENKDRLEGRAEGEMKKARETAINLQMMGLDVNAIAKAVNVRLLHKYIIYDKILYHRYKGEIKPICRKNK